MPRPPVSPLPQPGVHPSLVAAATQQEWEQHISNVITQPIEAAGVSRLTATSSNLSSGCTPHQASLAGRGRGGSPSMLYSWAIRPDLARTVLLQVSWGMQLLQEPVPSPEGPAAKAAVGDLINAAAAAAGATAIIAASASPGGLAEWLRGSVTHHLANTAQVPVVVLHRPKQPDRSRSGSPWWLAATMDSHLTRETPQQQVGATAFQQPIPSSSLPLLSSCAQQTMFNGLLYALLPVQAGNILCCLSKASLPNTVAS
jgi:hypothetical protein